LKFKDEHILDARHRRREAVFAFDSVVEDGKKLCVRRVAEGRLIAAGQQGTRGGA